MFASAQSVCTAQSESSISATFSSPLVNTTEPLSIAERCSPVSWKFGRGRREATASVLLLLLLLPGFLPLIKPHLRPASPCCCNLLISILYQGACVVAAHACVRGPDRRSGDAECFFIQRAAASSHTAAGQIRCHSIQSCDNDLELGLG